MQRPPLRRTEASAGDRRSVRVGSFDYSAPGAYFVTICALDRACLFGAVEGDEVSLSACGEIVRSCWDEIPVHFPGVEIDAFIVMPNHLHGILVIASSTVGALHATPSSVAAASQGRGSGLAPPRAGLPVVVRSYKAAVTSRCRDASLADRVWQRGYYDRIIRGEEELERIRTYIEENPARWGEDDDNPNKAKGGRCVQRPYRAT